MAIPHYTEPEVNNSFSIHIHVNTPKIKKIKKNSWDLLVFISVTSRQSPSENNIQSLRSQSRDIAQYPEIANQSNCAILGGSRVA